MYAESDEDFELVLQPIRRDYHENVTPDVHVVTSLVEYVRRVG